MVHGSWLKAQGSRLMQIDLQTTLDSKLHVFHFSHVFSRIPKGAVLDVWFLGCREAASGIIVFYSLLRWGMLWISWRPKSGARSLAVEVRLLPGPPVRLQTQIRVMDEHGEYEDDPTRID